MTLPTQSCPWSVIIPNQCSILKSGSLITFCISAEKGLQLTGRRSGPERNVVSLSTTVRLIVLFCFQVNEIYHDESLGVHINVVLVRMIMLGYAKVSCQFHFSVTCLLFWGVI